MNFRDIPVSRYIQLDPMEVAVRKYRIPSRVYWVAQGPRPYFALIQSGKVAATADIVFGPSSITRTCRIRVPLDAYSKYCICYDEGHISILLG